MKFNVIENTKLAGPIKKLAAEPILRKLHANFIVSKSALEPKTVHLENGYIIDAATATNVTVVMLLNRKMETTEEADIYGSIFCANFNISTGWSSNLLNITNIESDRITLMEIKTTSSGAFSLAFRAEEILKKNRLIKIA